MPTVIKLYCVKDDLCMGALVVRSLLHPPKQLIGSVFLFIILFYDEIQTNMINISHVLCIVTLLSSDRINLILYRRVLARSC